MPNMEGIPETSDIRTQLGLRSTPRHGAEATQGLASNNNTLLLPLPSLLSQSISSLSVLIPPSLCLYQLSSMATSLPPNGIASTLQKQANHIVKEDASKSNVAVHTFDPDASPQQKAASAGKGADQLKSKVQPK